MLRRGSGRPLVWVALIALFVVVSRAAYVSPFQGLSRDGPVYVNALKLDTSYDVPATPGKIGFVLAAALAQTVDPDPVHVYAVVTIALSVAAAVFIYLFATLYLPRRLAAAAAFAVMCGPIVWHYGAVIASYIVWLPCFPAIGYFGVRFLRERRPGLALAAAAATGAALFLRGDMIAFAGPLLVGILAVGRAPLKYWIAAGAVCVACACASFFTTASLTGGPIVYAHRIWAQVLYHVDEGPSTYAPAALVLRNGVKLSMFLVWNTHLLLGPALFAPAAHWRRRRGELVLMALWVLPTLAFSLVVTMCTGGLIFAALPLIAVAAGRGVLSICGGRAPRAAAVMTALGAVFAVQFLGAPLASSRTQRGVIWNVTFAKAGGPAMRAGYYYNLEDFGMDSSLSTVLREIRANEPVPLTPPDLREP